MTASTQSPDMNKRRGKGKKEEEEEEEEEEGEWAARLPKQALWKERPGGPGAAGRCCAQAWRRKTSESSNLGPFGGGAYGDHGSGGPAKQQRGARGGSGHGAEPKAWARNTAATQKQQERDQRRRSKTRSGARLPAPRPGEQPTGRLPGGSLAHRGLEELPRLGPRDGAVPYRRVRPAQHVHAHHSHGAQLVAGVRFWLSASRTRRAREAEERALQAHLGRAAARGATPAYTGDDTVHKLQEEEEEEEEEKEEKAETEVKAEAEAQEDGIRPDIQRRTNIIAASAPSRASRGEPRATPRP
ncbi:unnamed protein product [Prorocentrum cordatum]|uniref:Uncharacterized protein n=1 Tax=Prorocentrum cordatum TaxID=2364126 RepID=A0ABN9YCC7_9DINO|nr:unnamed protein product [Polarella glacialis]